LASRVPAICSGRGVSLKSVLANSAAGKPTSVVLWPRAGR
jgi:hypothetical protein